MGCAAEPIDEASVVGRGSGCGDRTGPRVAGTWSLQASVATSEPSRYCSQLEGRSWCRPCRAPPGCIRRAGADPVTRHVGDLGGVVAVPCRLQHGQRSVERTARTAPMTRRVLSNPSVARACDRVGDQTQPGPGRLLARRRLAPRPHGRVVGRRCDRERWIASASETVVRSG